MPRRRQGSSGRARGSIDELPSDAQAARHRLVSQIEERRNPRTNATVDQLLERYLDQFDGAAAKTLSLYRGYVRNHLSPFLGHIKVGDLDADVLDSFYGECRRCRDHCSGRRFTQHRTKSPHRCDHRCGPHRCRPLGPTTIRHMHFILSGAYKRRQVEVGHHQSRRYRRSHRPHRSRTRSRRTRSRRRGSSTRRGRTRTGGTLVWVAMTTGARRGELCALRWWSVDLGDGREMVWLRRAISRTDVGWVEDNLKSHQQRRVALDSQTADVLREYRDRCVGRAAPSGWTSTRTLSCSPVRPTAAPSRRLMG